MTNLYKNEDALQFISSLEENSVDLFICDGPYGVTGHDWDKVPSIQEYNFNLLKLFSRALKPNGSVYLFGKKDCIDFIDYRKHLNLKSKIIWYQPSSLAQGRRSFTNNYDLICYFTKGQYGKFNLDAIRVEQLVELTHRLRCHNVPSVLNGKYGKTKFNDKGKNPGDVWGDIKQLTYKSKELVSREMLNTIQKPIKLIERLVLASSDAGDLVVDPFCGSGTTAVVCKQHGRRFIVNDFNSDYIEVAKRRVDLCQPRSVEAEPEADENGTTEIAIPQEAPPKKRGRPAGSKNKKRTPTENEFQQKEAQVLLWE